MTCSTYTCARRHDAKEQRTAIEFGLKTFLESDKKYCIIEAGTGVGKSAIGLTLGRLLNSKLGFDEAYTPGSYFLTTQKVLQRQYENDFGAAPGKMRSVYSSSPSVCLTGIQFSSH